jgi:hypothetical protein
MIRRFFQEIQVEPEKIYKISCWIKTEGILNKAGSANLTLLNGKGIHTSVEYSDTNNDWKELTLYIKMTDSSSLKVGCRLEGPREQPIKVRLTLMICLLSSLMKC